jgi:hypothetical protein
VERPSGAQGSDRRPVDALAEGKVRHLRGLLQYDPAHETLSLDENRIFRPNTPAMAASVMDHRWTFSELLAYPALCQ